MTPNLPHEKSHNVVYQTARTDLLDLGKRGVLDKRWQGKKKLFIAPVDLSARLLKLEKQARE